eukprot:2676255-Karenia_brevis.AAC.1
MEKDMDAQIQNLQQQLDALQKQKEEKVEAYDLAIQTWTAREVELQAQDAKLDTSTTASASPPTPNISSSPPTGLVHISKIMEFKDLFLSEMQKPGLNTSTAQHFLDLFASSWGNIGVHLPQVSASKEQIPSSVAQAGTSSGVDSQGGTVREASPTPPPDQPAAKTPKSG